MAEVVCSKCGRIGHRRGGAKILKHKEDYVCGLCIPKKFSDKTLNEIIQYFKRYYR